MPAISGLIGALSVTEGDAARTIDPIVTLTGFQTGFNGGRLLVSGLMATDVISLPVTGEITLYNGYIRLSGVPIGTFTGGVGADLEIRFSSNSATRAVVERVLEALTYRSVSEAPVAAHNLTVTVRDPAGAEASASIAVTFTEINDAPTLSGLTNQVSFGEQAVNEGPQILDAAVTFADAESNFDGASLRVSGLLAEDRVSVAQGDGIAVVGGLVSVNGVSIGHMTGGEGGDLVVIFNANTTAAAIDALLQRLAFSNASDTPETSRVLKVEIADAAGAVFARESNGTNPVADAAVEANSSFAFADVDLDGRFDIVVGNSTGKLRLFKPSGNDFIYQSGDLNPFANVDVGDDATPAFFDFDDDGDADLVVGSYDGYLRTFENRAGAFVALTGAANPFHGINLGQASSPAFTDLDGDGDQDLVAGDLNGRLTTFANQDGVFVQMTGPTNPFAGIDIGTRSTPAFGDLDGDGDDDLIVGNAVGQLRVWDRVGQTFVARTASDPMLAALQQKTYVHPTLADLDGDGDVDLIVGDNDGASQFFRNTTLRPSSITVTVTAEDDPAVARDDLITPISEAGRAVGNLFSDNGHGADSDVDSAFAVVSVNGQTTAVGETLVLPSGAVLIVNADGTFAYDPGGAFDHLADASSGATGTTAQDTFTYTLSGGRQATVFLTVNGVDGDGDVLTGSDGDDILIGGLGADRIDGRGGAGDVADYSGSTAGVQIDLSLGIGVGGDAQGDLLSNIENLTGSAHADVLIGDAGANSLFGGLGDDLLAGGRGADMLDGASGSDTASYAGSNSAVAVRLYAGTAQFGHAAGDVLTGIENLIGSAFNDQLSGDAGDNVIEGGAGADTLGGREGHDTLSYASSNAAVVINLSNRTGSGGHAQGDIYASAFEGVIGSAFADTLNGGNGDQTIEGGLGNDQMNGGNGYDTLSYRLATTGVTVRLAQTSAQATGMGNDTISNFEAVIGSAFADSLTGNGLDNRLAGGAGADVLNGAAGFDVADYSASSAGVNLNLATGLGTGGDAAGDTLIAIEGLAGSAFADVLTGDDLDNLLTGAAGADALSGMGGTDTASYSGSNAAVSVDLGAGTASGGHAEGDVLTGIENLVGSAHDDVLVGDQGGNLLVGGAGSDELDGQGGLDTVSYAASGAAVVVRLYSGFASGGDATGDILSNIENLIGSSRSDQLQGNAASNRLEGGLGNDSLYGREGDDVLIGGVGTDRLYGGAGADVFVFAATDLGAKTIADFSTPLNDVIRLDSSQFAGFADVMSATVDVGGSAVISRGGISITLSGVTKARLSADDFEFAVSAPAPESDKHGPRAVLNNLVDRGLSSFDGRDPFRFTIDGGSLDWIV